MTNYVNWHYVNRSGPKPAKVPFDPATGEMIDHLDPASWRTYEQCAATGHPVGMVFTLDMPYFFLDLDGCRDPATGIVDIEAQETLALFPGAAIEVSISGTGFHLLGRCDKLQTAGLRNRWGGNREFYTQCRFMAFGQGFIGNPEIDWTVALVDYVPVRIGCVMTGLPDIGPVPEWDGITDDTDLIAHALESRGGAGPLLGHKASFKALWSGNAKTLARFFPSPTDEFDRSAADGALIMLLGFWTGKDVARVERLWRASPLALSRPDGGKKMRRAAYVSRSLVTGLRKIQKVHVRPGTDGIPAAHDPATARLIGLGTHDDIALAFAREYPERFRFNGDRAQWLEWTGVVWDAISDARMLEYVRLFCRDSAGHEERRPRAVSFWEAVAKALRGPFEVKQSELDRNHYLMNTPGGTIDLLTGQIRPHDPTDLLTKITRATPGHGSSHAWNVFLWQIACGDSELIRDLQIMLGASLSCAVEDHWVGYFFGTGRNGKSALIETVAHALGAYAAPVPSEPFMQTRNEQHPTGLTTLAGLRLAYANEVPQGRFFNAEVIKSLSGDEEITARYIGQNFFSFVRTFKLIFIGNDLPQVRAQDVAIKSRMRIIPFQADFSGQENPDLPALLRAEAAQILKWLIDGHAMWQAAGKRFRPGRAIQSASADYFAAQSTPDLWLSECAQIISHDAKALNLWPSSADAYASYRTWKSFRGEEPISMTRFASWISIQPGIEKIKVSVMRLKGLSLQSPQVPPGLSMITGSKS